MNYNGNTYYLFYDQVGSLRSVANGSGSIIKRIDYDSFGSIISETNPDLKIPFGFAGGLHDRDTDLVRFGARDYVPDIGRWIAKDPIDFNGGNTNLYGYVESNPIGKIDPSGLYPGPCGNENFTWVPDYPFWVFDFTGPCQNHDDCYGCKGKEKNISKSRCDFQFWIDMQKVCGKYIINPTLFLYCQTAAVHYYNAVFWGGKGAFENARK
jgi:RHS repeat-associated protein